MANDTEEQINQIVGMMETVVQDTSIPRNVRKAVSDAKEKLQTEDDLIVRTSSAIYLLDSIAEDINLPAHARTQIWTILSALEALKE